MKYKVLKRCDINNMKKTRILTFRLQDEKKDLVASLLASLCSQEGAFLACDDIADIEKIPHALCIADLSTLRNDELDALFAIWQKRNSPRIRRRAFIIGMNDCDPCSLPPGIRIAPDLLDDPQTLRLELLSALHKKRQGPVTSDKLIRILKMAEILMRHGELDLKCFADDYRFDCTQRTLARDISTLSSAWGSSIHYDAKERIYIYRNF